MTAANYMGLSRVLLAVAACALLIHGPRPENLAAAGVVGAAIVTDILDGVLARRLGTVSAFGAFLDVTADKVFLCPLLFLIADGDALLLWVAVVILIREFIVMGIRAYAASRATVIPAHRLGKAKSIVLYPAVILILIGWEQGRWLLYAAALLALVSGADYIRRAWSLLREGLTHTSILRPGSDDG